MWPLSKFRAPERAVAQASLGLEFFGHTLHKLR
jgi:hypothetical protein